MIKALVFDFFGVICPDLYWSWLKLKVPNLEERRDYFQNLSDRLDLGQIKTEAFAQVLSEETSTARESIIPQMEQTVEIDKNLLSLILRLRKNYKIGLLSNSSSSFIEEILVKNNLKEIFDSIIISEKVGFIKPQKEIFEIILKDLGLKENEVLFIDDRETNTLAAQKIGIQSIVYKSPDQLVQELDQLGII